MMLALVAGLGLAVRGSAVDPKVLPADTELLISIDIKQALESEMLKNNKELVEKARKEFEKKLGENPAKKYLDKAGLDPLKDISSVTIASNGTKELDAGFVLIEGKFNADKIYAAAEEAAKESGEGLKFSTIGTTKVMEISVKGEKTVYASVVKDSLIVAAPTKEMLTGTISRLTAGKGANLKASFKSALATVSPKSAFALVVTSDAVGRLAQQGPLANPQVGNELQKIDGLSLSVSLTKAIEVQAAVNAKDADTAQQMAFQTNLLLGLAKGAAQNKAQENAMFEPLSAIAQTLQAAQKGVVLTVRAEVTQENLEKLMKMLPKMDQ
jgi:hypothetical protein